MSIALTEEHVELTRVVRSFLLDNDARGHARSMLDAEHDAPPPYWKDAGSLGWFGLHLGEDVGGSGYGLLEAAVVIEQFGRCAAGGPLLPTVVTSAVVDACGSPEQRGRLLPRMADGSSTAGLGLWSEVAWDDAGRLDGDVGIVLGATSADVVAIVVGDDLVLVDPRHDAATWTDCPSVDRARRVSRLHLRSFTPDADAVVRGGAARAREVSTVLAATEAAGGAQACVEMAVDYAKVREAFGKPIGAFQAVKHHCVNMFGQSAVATAAAWGGVRSVGQSSHGLPAAVASVVALPAFVFCAQKNIQVHGGIGFTWEHDAHLHLRHAVSLMALFGDLDRDRARVFAAFAAGERAGSAVELPPETDAVRAEVRSFRERYETLPEPDRRIALMEAGYLVPTWPEPWGRAASPTEQLVIDQELGDVPRRVAGTTWVLLMLVTHGTEDQQRRWVRPALEGSVRMCQLFSEPGAGSDLASLSTKAVRVEGGWLVNGQKVWATLAHLSDFGLALVRTDPTLEKHAGLTCMMIDMRAPGVEVRPLRQITGDSKFNEVFLTDVFVPDDDVVGDVNGGWKVARAVLGNERSIIGGALTHIDIEALIGCALAHTTDGDPIRQEVASVLAEHYALGMLNLRRTSQMVATGAAGPESSLAKLMGTELDQRLTEVCARMLGPAVAAADGDAEQWVYDYLDTRQYTIGGGTSEIQRNIVGERVLGLPRG